MSTLFKKVYAPVSADDKRDIEAEAGVTMIVGGHSHPKGQIRKEVMYTLRFVSFKNQGPCLFHYGDE